jgi:hypothetical protein
MSNSDEGTTRRAVVGGVSATLAAAVGTSALAQQGQSGGAHSATTAGAGTGQSGSAQPLVDPRTKYPQPPFPAQQQDWPGLASRMQPPPDHGRTVIGVRAASAVAEH